MLLSSPYSSRQKNLLSLHHTFDEPLLRQSVEEKVFNCTVTWCSMNLTRLKQSQMEMSEKKLKTDEMHHLYVN